MGVGVTDLREVISNLSRLGIHVRQVDGVLQASPACALTPEVLAMIAEHRPVLIAALSDLCGTLEARIRRMADRWHYSSTELADALASAALDPLGWSLCVELDEEREASLRELGSPLRVDA